MPPLCMQELVQEPILMRQALQALVTPEMLPSFLSAARKLSIIQTDSLTKSSMHLVFS